MTRLGLNKLLKFVNGILLSVTFLSSLAFAQSGPNSLNISGGLFNSNGTPITNSNVNFKIEVYDKNSTCLMYSEQHLGVDLSATKGAFSLIIGAGTSMANVLEGTAAFDSKLFENPGAVAAFTGCPSGLTLNAGDTRLIRVSYNLGSGYIAMTPDIPLTSAAYAMVAETLQGHSASEFLLSNNNTSLQQANVEYAFSNTNWPTLKSLIDGTSGEYIPSTPTSAVGFNSQRLINVGTPTGNSDAATKGYADANLGGEPVDMTGVAPGMGGGKILTWDQTLGKWVAGSTGAVGLVASGTGLTGGPITSSGTLSVDVGVTANKILQLNGSAQIPAVNGSLLTNINAVQLQGRDISAVAPGSGNLLGWNATTNLWEATPNPGGTVTGLTGDVSGSGSGVISTTINSDAVTSSKINSTGIAVNRLLITDGTTGATVGYSTCALGEVLQWSATGWKCESVSLMLGNVGTAGTYGNSTQVAQVTVDATGRVTNLTNVNINFPVTSVNGHTGAVNLIPSDITGLGTAAVQNVGLNAGNVLQLMTNNTLPAIDGSQLTGVNATKLQGFAVATTSPGASQVLAWNSASSNWEPTSAATGSVTNVATGTGLTGGPITSTGTLAVDVGTTANKIVQLDGSARLPAVDGSLLTNLPVTSSQWSNNGSDIYYNLANVGVGTASPLYPLDVAGVVEAQSFHQTVANSATNVFNAFTWIHNGDTGAYTATGATQDPNGLTLRLNNTAVTAGTAAGLSLTTNNAAANAYIVAIAPASGNSPDIAIGQQTGVSSYAERMRIDAGGNVGIGTTTPNYKLDVAGTINASAVMVNGVPVGTGSGSVSNVTAGTGLTGGPITTAGTLNVDVGTSANKIVQLDGSARLPGVDGSQLTNVNAAKVGGYAIATTSPASGQYIGWNNSTSRWEPMASTAGTVTNIATGTGLTGGPITATGTLAVDVGTTANKIVQLDGSARLPNVDGSQLTNLPVTSSQWTTNGSNIYYNLGSVGIGTTSPQSGYALTVKRSGQLLYLEDTSGVNQHQLDIAGYYGGIGVYSNSSGRPAQVYFGPAVGNDYGQVGYNGTTMDFSSNPAGPAKDITFGTNNIERMRILGTNGNVGIGTTSPVYKLDVAGTVNASALMINGVAVGTSSSPWLLNGTSAYYNGGNVGIGTASPSGPFVVWDSTNSQPYLAVSTGGTLSVENGIDPTGTTLSLNGQWASSPTTSIRMAYGTFTQTSGQYVGAAIQPTYNQTSGTASNTDLLINRTQTAIGSGAQYLADFQVGGTSRFNVSNTGAGYFAGNVGVGTTSPTATGLHVYSTAGSGSPPVAIFQRINATCGSAVELFNSNVAADGWGIKNSLSGCGNLGDLNFIEKGGGPGDGTERVTFRAGGNVGIGTTTPNYKLDVAGTVNASALMINGVAVGTSSSPWQVSGANTYYNLGNVGIGVTAPVNYLGFDGTVARNIGMERNSTANTAGKDLTLTAGGATSGATNKAGGNLNLFAGVSTGSGGLGNLVKIGAYPGFGSSGSSDISPVTTMSVGAQGVGIAVDGQSVVDIQTPLTVNQSNLNDNGSGGRPTAILSNQVSAADGGYLVLQHTRAGGPLLANDQPGRLDFQGTTSTSAFINYAGIRSVVVDPTNATAKGKLIFSTANSTTFNPVDRMVIDSSGNVGVGTPTPNYKVDVNGTLNATGLLINGVAVGTSSSPWLLNGSNAYYNAGNVGIGTSTPGSSFEVNYTNTATSGTVYGVKITPTYNQASATTNNTDFLINRTETAVGSGNQYLMDLQVAGASEFSVDNNGIATARYGFQGSFVGSGQAQNFTYSPTGTNANVPYNSNGPEGFDMFNSDAHDGNWEGFGLKASNAAGHIQAGYIAAVSTPNATAAYSPSVVFGLQTGSNAYTESMRINYNGNVGIGTTTPNYKLDVAGTINASSIKINGVSVGTSSSPWQLNGTNAYYNGGNVGIGTTTPTGTFDVEGGTAASGNGTNITLIAQSGAAGQTGGTVYILPGGGGASGGVAIGNSFTPLSNSVAIGYQAQAYGNSGVAAGAYAVSNGALSGAFGGGAKAYGDYSLSLGYDVAAGDATNNGNYSIAMGAGHATGTIPKVTGNNSVGIFMGDQSGVNISTNNVMSILGGNVGIGTVSPTEMLEVNGNILADGRVQAANFSSWSAPAFAYSPTSASNQMPETLGGPIVNLHSTVGTDGYGSFIQMGSMNSALVGQYAYLGSYSTPGASPAIVLGQSTSTSSYTERMRIDQSGNIGIGTTTPNYNLDVNGTINASSIKINGVAVGTSSSPWQLNGSNAYYTAGNVGVGTTTPNAKFEVAGPLRLSNSTADTFLTPVGSSVPTKINIPIYDPGAFGQVLAFGVPNGANATSRAISVFDGRTSTSHQPPLAVFSPDESQTIGFNWSGQNASGQVVSSMDLSLVPGGGTDAVHILSNGMVGVGTPTPRAMLEIASSSSGRSAILIPRDTTANRPPTGVNGMIRYNTDTAAFEGFANGGWGSLASGGSSQWSNSGSNIYYNLGNVGVGTTSPSAKLTVLGPDSSNGSTIADFDDSTGVSRVRVMDQGGSLGEAAGLYNNGSWGLGLYNEHNSGHVSIYTGSPIAERVRVTASGNVGIGSSAPGQNLSFGGQSAQSIGMDRSTGTVGNNLTIQAGGAKSASTNRNGGTLNLAGGTATGSGFSQISFQVANGGSSGTSDLAPIEQMLLSGTGGSGISYMSELEMDGDIYINAPNSNQNMLDFQMPTGSDVMFFNDGSHDRLGVGFAATHNVPAAALQTWDAANNRIGVGTLTPQAIFDVQSTTSGKSAILIPRDSTANRPVTGVNGMIRYNTNTAAFEGFANGAWGSLGSGGGGGATKIGDLSDAHTDYVTDHNLFMGSGAGVSIQAGGGENLIVGQDSGSLLTTGYSNTVVGYNAMPNVTTGYENSAFGWGAMRYYDAAGYANTAIGAYSMFWGGSGNHNTAVGDGSMGQGPNGSSNTSVGAGSLAGPSGDSNSALGAYAASQNSTGAANVAVGNMALYHNLTSDGNTVLGAWAGENTIGDHNTFVGNQAAQGLTSGSFNTILGYNVASATLATGSNNIVIGTSNSVDTPAAGTSNFLNIGNIIFATGMTGTVAAPAGNVGIGTTTPGYKLDVNGTINASAILINGVAVATTSSSWQSNGANIYYNAGNVGIGTTTPGYPLDIVGNAHATAFVSTSDERLKTNISTIEGLDLILKLRGVRYKWKANNQSDFGVIAQEVEKVLPEAVVTDPNTGLKAVKYQNLVGPLIESTKDLYGMCKASDEQMRALQAAVERRLASVETENADLKKQLSDLQKRMEAIERKLQDHP